MSCVENCDKPFPTFMNGECKEFRSPKELFPTEKYELANKLNYTDSLHYQPHFLTVRPWCNVVFNVLSDNVLFELAGKHR